MRTFLVLPAASELEAPGGEFRVLTGQVMREPGLLAWGARNLGTPADATFLVVAEAAREAGVSLFALPTRDVRRTDPDTETVEATVGGRTILVLRRRADPTGPARVRWQGDDGGVRETEVPAFLADALANAPGRSAIASEAAPSGPPSIAPTDAPTGPGSADSDS